MKSSIHFCSINPPPSLHYVLSLFVFLFVFFFSITVPDGHWTHDQCVLPISPISLVPISFNDFQNLFYSFDRIPQFFLISFMTYSITLWPFLDTFLFFRATPFLPTCRCILAIPCLPQFFRTFQLIISRKNLRVYRIWFFFSILTIFSRCISDITFLNLSLSFSFPSWRVYLFSHSHSYYYHYLQKTN